MNLKPFNHFDQIQALLVKATREAIVQVASDIENEAKIRAPVDTGNLQESIYYKSDRLSTASTGPNRYPELPAPDENTVIVAVGATYGVYLEYGTSRMPAQPFFLPSILAVKDRMGTRLQGITIRLESEAPRG
jgi:HK97 gp10 family phage protein